MAEEGLGAVPYAELHCRSNMSFLEGASSPEELVGEAVRLGLGALALTDRDGLYGAVRLAAAAQEAGLATVFGAELTLSPSPSNAPPGQDRLVVLARNPDGYARLSRAISLAQLRGSKGRPSYVMEELANLAGGDWAVLTGGPGGLLPSVLESRGPSAAAGELGSLVEMFGRENVFVELWDHGSPLDSSRNDALAVLALSQGVEPVATNAVSYARPSDYRLASALTAISNRCSLDDIDPLLDPSTGAHLRSGSEMRTRLARWPGVLQTAASLGKECAFSLALVSPGLARFPLPDGMDETSYLCELAQEGARRRYGPPGAERVPGAYRQIAHELEVIGALGFAGYFLVVWDIVQFCSRRDIYCQGRGSAANSAVCYALGITNADAVSLGLLFERFLSPERDGPPDIDLDIESGRREEVISYVYERHGRHHAAQVANVITYRARSALRDAGRALGFPQGSLDSWSAMVDSHRGLSAPFSGQRQGPPESLVALASEIEGMPRHLGIHSGGMVICDRPVIEVCPVEWATMANRSVLQWDKDDCAAAGLVKFDLLGLGMLSALHEMVDLVKESSGEKVDLAMLDQDPAVYRMLGDGDSVGVFQVESRAQMATLPRLRPECFYDLVVEVALIRPGPIQGNSVHPYLRRREGAEAVTYLHPLLERSLAKTLGVPLFQEQLMQMAMDVAGFSAAEADQLRSAMGAKRSKERMERLRSRFFSGMEAEGITGTTAERIWEKMAAFATFGFPESHSVSFAYLVYSSAWMKLHHPAAFLAGLLNAQPMGFWSPQSLVADARRHGVEVRRPHVNYSDTKAHLEPLSDAKMAVRLGLRSVRSLGSDVARRIVDNRGEGYGSIESLARSARVSRTQLEALAVAGALEGLVATLDSPRVAPASPGAGRTGRRRALWAAGAMAAVGSNQTLEGIVAGAEAPLLDEMGPVDIADADLWATGVSVEHHPMSFARGSLGNKGVLQIGELSLARAGKRVLVAGIVTHRQRPGTAKGTVFMNLEDETGLLNVIFPQRTWDRLRPVAGRARALVVSGKLERASGVTNLVAEDVKEIRLGTMTPAARDFR